MATFQLYVAALPLPTATIPLDPIPVVARLDILPGRQTMDVETSMNAVKDLMLSVLTHVKELLLLMQSASMLLDPLIVDLVVLEELSSVLEELSSAILRLTIETMFLMEQDLNNGLSVFQLEREWN